MKVEDFKMQENVVIAFGKELCFKKLKETEIKHVFYDFCKVPFKLPLISMIFEIRILLFFLNAIVNIYLQLNY